MTTTTIEGYEFNISKKIRLVTTSNKFWEAECSGKKLQIRVGKDKGGAETNIEEMTKAYPTPELARASLIEKIKEKLIKGYFTQDGLKEAPKTVDNSLKRDATDPDHKSIKSSPVDTSKKSFSGEFYERAGESVKL